MAARVAPPGDVEGTRARAPAKGSACLDSGTENTSRVVPRPPRRRLALLALLLAAFDVLALLAVSRWGRPLGLPSLDLFSTDGALLLLVNAWGLEQLTRAGRRACDALAARLGVERVRLAEATTWAVVSAVVAAGLAHRLWLTFVLGAPFTQPDSPSYLAPALLDPLLPLSEMRTLGTPWLCSLGFALTGGPAGFLLVHHALWLVSTLVLVVALARRLELKLPAVLVAVYLTFTQKNVEFELTLMSEHASRTLYVLFLGVLVLSWGHVRTRTTLALASIACANVLVKPTALVSFPALAIVYALFRRMSPGISWRTVAAQLGLAVAVLVACQATYALAYRARFGRLATSAYTGTALFSQVGHLVDLDRVEPPDLADSLRATLPAYAEHYAARGRHEPNWLAFGTPTPDLLRDFGEASPSRTVREHVWAHRDPARTHQQQLDDTFKELALAGIRARPRRYLALAAGDLVRLYRDGVVPFYPYNGPEARRLSALAAGQGAPAALERHREVALEHLTQAYRQAERPEPPPAALLGRGHAGSPLPTLPLTFGHVMAWASITWSELLQQLLHRWQVGWLLLLALPLAWRRRAPDADALRLVLVTAAIALGYGVLLALICISEVGRFTTNVQDLVFLGLVLLGWVELRAVNAWLDEAPLGAAPTSAQDLAAQAANAEPREDPRPEPAIGDGAGPEPRGGRGDG